jgi:pimeloyl-ACP methyl ester carboxylesterase
MTIVTLPEITAKTIETARLTTRVLFSGPDDGRPVLFLHGNTSSATWWEATMANLPPAFRAIAPDQRGFGEADPDAKIQAVRGMGNLADDAAALLDSLGIDRTHIVGNSLGGSVIWRMLIDHPERLLSVVLVNPGSPFGFGGTKDVEGTPCYPDFAGSGGGLVNPELIRRLQEGDRSLNSQFSPRAALRTMIVKPPCIPAREDELVEAMLAMHIGPQDSPGDTVPSPNWPYQAPGEWGAANALSPKYAGDIQALYRAEPKVDILWIRGGHDLLVSDTAASDVGYLGKLGLIPGWPGEEIFPPQPMVTQTRFVLHKYAEAGGSFKEVVLEDGSHAPYLDQPEKFNLVLHAYLSA